jgi:hypothetical protein
MTTTHLVSTNPRSIDLESDARVQDEEKQKRYDVHDHQVHPVDVHFDVNLKQEARLQKQVLLSGQIV